VLQRALSARRAGASCVRSAQGHGKCSRGLERCLSGGLRMKAFVGVTDGDWFEFLSSRVDLEEVNFWQPGGKTHFRALKEGELFLFKLHSPDNYIVGGGLFVHSTLLPVSVAWDAFEAANGVPSLAEMRARVEFYRRRPA